MNENILTTREQGTEEHWISISDMMAGLMVIFLFIAISYMLVVNAENEKIEEQNKRIEQIVEGYVTLQSALYDDLRKEFETKDPGKWKKKWKARLVEPTLSVQFEKPFDQGVSDVPQNFKKLLDDFFPRYIKILSVYKADIAEIRIEGHTSSEWTGFKGNSDVNKEKDYFRNMELSQDRARKCLTHVLELIEDEQNREWIKDKLTANGLSSSKLVDVNGKLISKSKLPEDSEKSRRVEFRVRTKAEKQIVAFLKKELSKEGIER